MSTSKIVTTPELSDIVADLKDTSSRIRYLVKNAPEGSKPVWYAYLTINALGYRTKTGGEIRYQHVRNVTMMKLSGE